jgi:hypothetical protein
MDKTVEVSQAARDAAATAYAWQRGAIEEHHASILAGTLDCHPLVDLFARFEANTRATQPEAALREALKQAGRLLMAIEDTVPIAKMAQGIILAALKDHRHG